MEVVGSSPIKRPHCFLEQETLPLLLKRYWLVPGMDSSVISQSSSNKGLMKDRLKCQICPLFKYRQNQKHFRSELNILYRYTL